MWIRLGDRTVAGLRRGFRGLGGVMTVSVVVCAAVPIFADRAQQAVPGRVQPTTAREPQQLPDRLPDAEAEMLAEVQAFLGAGGQPDHVDADGETLLHHAVFQGFKQVTDLLVARGATIDVRNQQGWTPLHVAASRGHYAIAALLIANGADLNAKTQDGWTPLHLAVGKGYHTIVGLLVAKKADIHAKDGDG